ncbi:MAG: hypothetical protein HC884_15770 [Chloroflexaceae bacterium]|nr:hypothetical protein [Chloroflexaceae bacterium]
MRTINIEQWNVGELVHRIPGIAHALRSNNVDMTNRMNLGNAAAAASASTEHILAVADYRLRQAARRGQAVKAPAKAVEAVYGEAELVV